MMSIQLVIKSPNQQVDDIKVESDSSWTVENLKDHLCTVYPTKPTKTQQKIIYGGRLLPDHLLLKEVITRDQEVHIMHLVCPQSTYSSKTNTDTTKAKTEEETTDMAQPPLPNFFEDPVNSEGLRQRAFDPQQYVSSVNSFYSQAQLPQANVMPMASMYNAYQLATMQQSYAQFLAQCFAQGQPAHVVPNPNLMVNQQQQPGTNVPPIQPNVNPPVANARRLNENEDGDRFDLLDSVYVMTRALMLFAVLYFYSTPERIMVVLGLVLIFCLYHLSAQRRQAEQNIPATIVEERNRNPRPEADIGTNSNAEQQTDQSDDSSENSPGSAEPAEEQPVPQRLERPSKLETAFVFVKTLFTSLIPDQPLPVDVN